MTGGERGSSDPANTRRAIVLATIACVAAALVGAWSLLPSLRSIDPATIATWRATLQATPFAIVVALFVALGFIGAPASLMIGATFVCFGTTRGLAYAYAGMLANGCAVRAVVRLIARDAVVAWLARRADSRLAAFERRVARRGILAVAALRISPLPFAVQNVVAGVTNIRLVDFMIGTAIGIIPVVAVMAGVASQFDAWIEDPQMSRILVLAASGAVGTLVLWLIARRRSTD